MTLSSNNDGRFHRVFEHLSDGVIITDAEGYVTSLNTAAASVTGWSCAEARGRPLHEVLSFVDQGSKPPPDKFLRELFPDGSQVNPSQHLLLRNRAGNTSPIILRDYFRDEAASEAVVVFNVAETNSLTGQESSVASSASDPLLRAITDQVPVMIWTADAKGIVDYCNQQWLEFTGLAADQIQGTAWMAALHPDDVESTRRAWSEACAKGTDYIIEQRLRGADGNYSWFLTRARPVRDDHGRVIQWFGANSNINERKLAEEKASDANHLFQTILDSTPSLVFFKDLAGRFRMINRAFVANLGRTSQEVEGPQVNNLIPPALAETLAQHDRWVMEHQTTRIVEEEILPLRDAPRFFRSVYFPLRDGHGQLTGTCGIATDITERKRMELAIRDSEARFRLLFDQSPLGAAVTSLDHHYVQVNQKLCEITGYTSEELIGRTFTDITHPDDLKRNEQLIHTWNSGVLDHLSLDKRYVRKDGTSIWVHLTVGKVCDATGSPLYYLSLTEDISERKEMERQLQATQYFVEQSNDCAYWVAEDGQIVFANDAGCRSLGYSREELLQLRVIDVDADHDEPHWIAHFDDLKAKGSLHLESRLRKKSGEIYPVEIRTKYLEFDGKGYSCAIVRDISERKQSEQILRESERRFRGYFHMPLAGFAISAPDKRWLDVNEKFCDMLGYSREELLQRTWAEVTHPDDVATNVHLFDRAVAGEIDSYVLEKRFVRKSGEAISTELAAYCVRKPDGTVDHFLTLIQDITERKRAEQAVRDSERLLRSYFDSPLAGFCVTSAEKGWIEVNDRLCEMLGYSREELLQKTWVDLTHPEDLAADIEQFDRLLRGEIEEYVLEKRYLRKDGEVLPAEIAVGCVRKPDGSVDYLVALIQDIRERKRAEESLRASEARIRAIGDNLPRGCIYQYQRWTPDAPGRFLYFSQGLINVMGVTPEQGIREPNLIYSLIHPEDAARVNAVEVQSMIHQTPFEVEFRNYQDGMVRWIEARSSPRRLPDGSTVWDGIALNITERKVAEEAVRNRESQLRAIGDNLPGGCVFQYQRWPKENRQQYLYLSKQIEEILEVPTDEILADPSALDALIHPEDYQRMEAAEALSMTNLAPLDVEFRIHSRTGKLHWVVFRATPRTLPDGSTIWDGVAIDITTRKEAEEALRKSEAELRQFADSLPQLAWIALPGGYQIYFNRRAIEYAGTMDQEGFQWEALVHPDDKELVGERWHTAQRTGENYEVTSRIRRKDGIYRWHVSRAIPIKDSEGRVVRWLGTATDIDDLRIVQEELRQSLHQRELLLKEVHHRVKNNLQVICSLLLMQARRSADPRTQVVLREAQERVLAMALVHQNLYQSGDLAHINFPQYVRHLTENLAHSLGRSGSVQIRADIASIPLGIDQAIPCGLILNELISNAFKHGFSPDEEGWIRVEMSQGTPGEVLLIVEDNGRGIELPLQPESTSLGLQLVQDLTDQLHGTFEITSPPGTRVAIRFPLPGINSGGNRT